MATIKHYLESLQLLQFSIESASRLRGQLGVSIRAAELVKESHNSLGTLAFQPAEAQEAGIESAKSELYWLLANLEELNKSASDFQDKYESALKPTLELLIDGWEPPTEQKGDPE